MIIFKQEIETFLTSNIPDEYEGVAVIEWTNFTAYTFGEIRRDGSWYYKVAINISATEDRKPPSEDKTAWAKIAPSNTYALIDTRSTTETSVTTGDIVVTLENIGRYDSLAIGNFRASNILVELLNASDVVEWSSNNVISELGAEAEANWWSYYYSPLTDIETRYNIFIPMARAGAKIKITLSESISGGVDCGFLIVGKAVFCGDSVNEVNFKYEDNSIKEKDTFGETTLIQRYPQELSDVDTRIETSLFTGFKKKIRGYYGIPIAVVIDESENSGYENLLTLAYLDDASKILRDGNSHSICNFSFSELV